MIGHGIKFWFVVVVSCCGLNFGIAYNMAVLPGIGGELLQQYYGIADSRYANFMWSFISPFLIFPLFAGWMIDASLGKRWSMIIFYATSLLGQLIWLSGSLFPYFAYNIALIGYMVMGIGISCFLTIQYTISAEFFIGKWLTTICACMASLRFIVYYFGVELTSVVVNKSTPTYGIATGTLVFLFNFIFVISLYFAMDNIYKNKRVSPRSLIVPVRFKTISIILVLFCALVDGTAVGIMYDIIYDLLINNYGVNEEQITLIHSVGGVYFMGVTIFISMIVDRVGYHLYWLQLGSLLLTVSTFLLTWVSAVPYYVTLFGIGLGIAMGIFPGISLISFLVSKRYWGRAFSLIVINIVVSRVTAKSIGFFFSQTVLSMIMYFLTIIGFFGIVSLFIFDYRKGGILNRRAAFWRDFLWISTPSAKESLA